MLGVETVRYCQRRGLMQESERSGGAGSAGGFRRYCEEDLRRLRFIRSAQTAGFTLEQIRELISLDATDDRPRARHLARARIAALNEEIVRLQAARDALRRLVDECGAGSSGPCPILAAFENR